MKKGGTTTILGGMMVEIFEEVSPNTNTNENYSPQESSRSTGSYDEKQNQIGIGIPGAKTGLTSFSKVTTSRSQSSETEDKGYYSTESSSDSESSYISKRRSNYSSSFKSSSLNSNSISNTNASYSYSPSNTTTSSLSIDSSYNLDSPRWMCVLVCTFHLFLLI